MEAAIVEGVVKTAVSTAVPSLAKLIMYEWGLDKGVTNGLKNLRAELRSMQAFDQYVSSMPPDQLDLQVKIRGREVGELLSAIETSLYIFTGKIGSTNGSRIAALKKWLINHQIDNYIKETLVKIEQLRKRHGRYPTRSSLESSSTQRVDPHILAMYTREPNPVGIEEAVEKLTRMLSKNQFVSVVGPVGLGKTTLARTVYNKMKLGFDSGAFVTVGKRADTMKVLTDIFSGLYMDKYGKEPHICEPNHQLQNFFLEDQTRRFLIIIDDLCEEGTWKLLESIFEFSPGSKVITTTRNQKIAQEVGGVYDMKPLSPEISKRLLSIKAEAGIHDTVFSNIADKIFQKCGGVPLVINAIGRFLAKNKSMGWYRAYDSIGFSENQMDGALEHVKKALSRSYYDLPYHIQKCFLYLSLFLEDHWIEKNMLIWRWVAEGLIPESEENSGGLFELGEACFNELIDRCMIQWAVSPRDIGQGGCRIHGLMFNVIRDLSNSRDPSFSTVLGMGQGSPSQTTILRLAIHKTSPVEIAETSPGPEQNPNTCLQIGHVLSFYAMSCPGNSLPQFSNFKRLRVIDLECCDLSVGEHKLKHLAKSPQLAYVGLSGTPVPEGKLPKKIGGLKFVQTLDVRGTGIKELPQFVCELKKLTCLRAGKGTRMTGRAGALTSLEELWLHSADKEFAEELREMKKLRVLVIHFDKMDEDIWKVLVVSLGYLTKLQVLQIWSDAEGKVRLSSSWEPSVPSPKLRQLLLFGVILPKPMTWIKPSFVSELSKLLLEVKNLKASHLRNLGKLPSLLSLYLHSEDNWLPTYTATKDEFKVLEFLYINIEMVCGDGALPRIHELEVATIKVGTDVGLRETNMPLLERATYHLDCKDCDPMKVYEEETKLMQASKDHPNHPSVTIKTFNDANTLLVRHPERRCVL